MLIIAFVTFLLSFYLVWRITRYGGILSSDSLLDIPNDRSLHDKAVPRSGGIALFISFYTGVALYIFLFSEQHSLFNYMLIAIPIAFISYWDDKGSIAMHYRLLLHSSVAIICVIGMQLSITISVMPDSILILISMLFIVWMINLYNFMDGMDGLAAMMAVIGFSTLGSIAYIAGDNALFVLTALLVAASLGFLCFNFPPAQLFMGDTGSTLLGFWVAVLLLWSDQTGILPIYWGMVIFSPFIWDASVTLLRRIFKREKFWQAHRSHYYQRLVLLGYSHRQVLLVITAWMVFCAALTLMLYQASNMLQIAGLLCTIMMYIILSAIVHYMEYYAER